MRRAPPDTAGAAHERRGASTGSCAVPKGGHRRAAAIAITAPTCPAGSRRRVRRRAAWASLGTGCMIR